MSHTSVKLAAPFPPPARYADPHDAGAPSPARSVDDGTVEAAAPVLRLTDIDLSFDGIQAFGGTDPTVAPGGVRAIISPNGAGKSPLVNIVNGLYWPDRGGIWLNERATHEVSSASLAGLGITRAFRNLALFKDLHVRDNTALGHVQRTRSAFVGQLTELGRAHHELAGACERAEQVIHFVGLTEVQGQPVGTLPYGLQKCTEPTRVPVAWPHLLLLDEPLAGMTVTEKVQVADLIRAARDQWGTTIVLIEYDIGLTLDLSGRMTVLDHGRKIADSAPQAVRDDPAVIGACLDVAHVAADAAEAQRWATSTWRSLPRC